MIGRGLFELTKKFRVLMRILWGVTPKEAPVFTLSGPADRVEFVVSQDRASRTGFAHRAGNPEDFSLFRTAVNKVADKDYFPFWMSENTFNLCIVEFAHQAMKGISVAVDVANNVVMLYRHGWKRSLVKLNHTGPRLLNGLCGLDITTMLPVARIERNLPTKIKMFRRRGELRGNEPEFL
jgi:hypothetical protein